MDADNHTYLDINAIKNLSAFLSVENLQNLYQTYIQDSEELLGKLDVMLAEENTPEATRLIHSLKSTSANVGAIRLFELAKSLEILARAEQFAELRSQFEELTRQFARTRSAIEQLDIMAG